MSKSSISTRTSAKRVHKSKKIILGKPTLGKQKMSLEELKAMNRQIKLPSVKTPLNYFNCQNHYATNDIMSLSRNLKENLWLAKSKMMESLKNSSIPQDIQIYKYLSQTTTLSPPSSPGFCSEEEEYAIDDCSSVSSKNSITSQLRLVTNDSGFVSIVYNHDKPMSIIKTDIVRTEDIYSHVELSANSPFQTLDTPSHSFTAVAPVIDMGLFLNSWKPENSLSRSLSNHNNNNHNKKSNNDVTEDQIDLWLQRGGGDYYSPITMATDQELADLLDFDM